MINNTLLRVEKIRKEFGGIVALDDVDLEIGQGEIHAICGENGAGKSTICNVLTGILTPDSGKIFYEDKEVLFTHPSQALEAGIRMVYQERNLITYLTGAQNILLNNEPLKSGILIDESALLKKAEALKEQYKINVPLKHTVSLLSAGQRQSVEILRALVYKPKLLILDEPTSSLSESESEALFRVIHKLKADGVSVVLITHKMNEIFDNADIISIIRNGKKITTKPKEDMTEDECIRLMVNRNLASYYPPVINNVQDMILEVKDMDGYVLVNNNSFCLHRGEVLGFYGLVGAGRSELIDSIFGLRPIKSGTVLVDGQEVEPNMNAMIDKRVYLVPDDRKEKGLFDSFNLCENLTVSFYDQFVSKVGIIKSAKEKKIAKRMLDNDTFSIKYDNMQEEVTSLSGGNQQKVVISRWVSKENINVLVLDDPTVGIDVGTKSEIYTLIRNLAEKKNIGIIVISSEMPELTGICDRILVFKEGEIKGEFKRQEFNDQKILSMAL